MGTNISHFLSSKEIPTHLETNRVRGDTIFKESMMNEVRTGLMAEKYLKLSLPLKVCRGGAGYYIGTFNQDGPISRESVEYFKTRFEAEQALENGAWTQLYLE